MTINQEILVYASLPFKKYRWIGYATCLQLGFLGVNLVVLPTPRLVRERQEALKNRVRRKQEKSESTTELEGDFEPNPDYDPATLAERFKRLKYSDIFTIRNVVSNITERPYLCTGLLGAATLVSSAFWFYARRMVHMITLLPGERVRFATFSPFCMGKPPIIEVPLRNVSCVQGRKATLNYSILKLKGYTGFHLVHKSEGQFLEPELYDQHLGWARSWVKE